MRVTRSASMLVLAAFVGAGLTLPAVGQQKRDKEKEKRARQEAGSRSEYYKKWLQEDVVYVISEEEKSVFKNLANEEERESFIEQFWLRRDPDPRTADNEFKEEHYRRIAYANERYASGIPGWRISVKTNSLPSQLGTTRMGLWMVMPDSRWTS